MAKPKFKLGDRVKFTRVASRQLTMLAADNDPKPWWDVQWAGVEPRRVTTIVPPPNVNTVCLIGGAPTKWRVSCGEQQGIYVGTRTKQNGILIANHTEDGRAYKRFKRFGSAPCGLVVTDVRKNPILVLMEDLEHV